MDVFHSIPSTLRSPCFIVLPPTLHGNRRRAVATGDPASSMVAVDGGSYSSLSGHWNGMINADTAHLFVPSDDCFKTRDYILHGPDLLQLLSDGVFCKRGEFSSKMESGPL